MTRFRVQVYGYARLTWVPMTVFPLLSLLGSEINSKLSPLFTRLKYVRS
jgi:hypothetical protein